MLWAENNTPFCHTVNSSMWDLLLRQMCIELTPKKFPGYSRSVPALLKKHVDCSKSCWRLKKLDMSSFRSPDSLCQWRWKQKGARVSRGAASHWRKVQLRLPQRPRVHPHPLPLPHQLWGVHKATVEHVQAAACSGVPALPHQVPQGPHGQEGGDHCPL